MSAVGFAVDICCGPALGEHWLPARSKLVVALKPDGMEIVVHVDPGAPHAWRAEPYYTEIRGMAGYAERTAYTLFVQIGRKDDRHLSRPGGRSRHRGQRTRGY